MRARLCVHLTIAVVTIITALLAAQSPHCPGTPPRVPPNAPYATATVVPVAVKSSPPSDPFLPYRQRIVTDHPLGVIAVVAVQNTHYAQLQDGRVEAVAAVEVGAAMVYSSVVPPPFTATPILLLPS